MLPSHAAENLFWVGRYTERIFGNARFLRTVMQFLAEGNKLITDITVKRKEICWKRLPVTVIHCQDLWVKMRKIYMQIHGKN